MGNELSSDENRQRRNQSSQNVSQAEVRRLLANQRRQYERKCEELVANAAVIAQQAVQELAPSLERNRTPYNYTRDDLYDIGRQTASLYPDLNQPSPSGSSEPHSFSFATNNANSKPPHDFVFVKNPQKQRNRHMSPSAPPAPRERSQSSGRTIIMGGCEVMCPTCGSPYGANIFQCGTGHSACGQCKASGRRCRLCGLALTEMRNFVLEEYVSQTKVNCPHSDEGCKLVLKVSDIDSHVNECPFKEQKCPLHPKFVDCVWRGKLRQLSNHFERYHKDRWQDRKNEDAPEMQLDDAFTNSSDVHLIVKGVFNFLLHLQVSQAARTIYMAVQLIGTRHSAEKWIYEIHVYNKNESRRKYMFTDNCSSNVESVEDIFKDGRCAVLPFASAETFVNNGSIAFKVFVKCINERLGTGANQRGRGRN